MRFCIQGMGYSRLAILAGVCEMVGRIIASLVLVPLIGFVGICLASPIAWIMADLFLVPAYCHTINRMKNISFLNLKQLIKKYPSTGCLCVQTDRRVFFINVLP